MESRRVQSQEQPFKLHSVAVAVIVLSGLLAGRNAWALPGNGRVTAGSGSLQSAGSTLVVNQASDKLIVDWDKFNIAAGETVRFVQPGSGSAVLNRVTGTDPSTIFGNLTSNGQVFLSNPNGILFGRTGSVDVGGLVATTLRIANADFLAGNIKLTGGAAGQSVVNEGSITAANGGYVALVAPEARNEGLIQVNGGGTAALAAGNAVTLRMASNQLLGLTIDEGAMDTLAANHNLIVADGGKVILNSRGKDAVLSGVVNNTGVIRASTVANKGGVIQLLADGGTVQADGTLKADAPNGGHGGQVETSGAKVDIAPSIHVDTGGATPADRGSWLIDPTDYVIAASGGNTTGAALGFLLDHNTADVTISTASAGAGAGDIFVNDAVSWSSANGLHLIAHHDINVNANVTANGSANISLRADALGNCVANAAASACGTVNFAGGTKVAVTGGTISILYDVAGTNGAPGTTVGVQGSATSEGVIANLYKTKRDYSGNVILNGVGSTLFDAMLVNDVYQLQSIRNAGANPFNFALGRDIDAGATKTANGNVGWNNGIGFISLLADVAFQGKLDGAGQDGLANHRISNLYINDTVGGPLGYAGIGLFGALNGTVRNLSILNANVTGLSKTGIVAGRSLNPSVISNVDVSGAVSGVSGYVAGVTGDTFGKIINTRSAANVTAPPGSSAQAAGLVVFVAGGTVDGCEATGTVIGDGQAAGLVHTLYGPSAVISNSRATGRVYGGGSTTALDPNFVSGGLVGQLIGGATIDKSYATGDVEGWAGYVGGLVGYVSGNTVGTTVPTSVLNSYATGNVISHGLAAGGAIGASQANVGASHATVIITNVHSFGGVQLDVLAGSPGSSTRGAGGLVGLVLDGTTQIQDASSLGRVWTTNANIKTYAGGLSGSVGTGASFTRAFSAGLVQNSIAANTGGLYGSAQSGLLESSVFWNTGASGQTLAVGTGSSNGAGKTAAELMQAATYGWDFTSPSALWQITGGASYATPKVVFPTGVQALWGTGSGLTPSSNVGFGLSGTTLVPKATVGADGFFYKPVALGSIGAGVLFSYSLDPTKPAINVREFAGGDATNFDLVVNGVRGSGATVSIADFQTAQGPLGGTLIPFSASSGTLTTAGGFSFSTASGTSLNLAGTIQAAGISLNGPTLLAADSTLDAGTSAISIGGAVSGAHDLTLKTSSAVTQAAPIVVSGLRLAGGNVTLTNAGNDFGVIAGNVASASVVDSNGLTVGTVQGQTGLSSTATLTVASAAGDLVLDAAVSTTNAPLTLAATHFVNHAGAGAVNAGATGRWLIYSNSPEGDSFGGLNSSNLPIWNRTYTASDTVTQTGNRYLFAAQPTLTVSASSIAKQYGDTVVLTATKSGSVGTAYGGVTFTANGEVSAAAYGNVFTQETVTGSPSLATAGNPLTLNASPTPYAVTAGVGSLAVPAGYALSLVNGSLTVTPRTLTVSGATAANKQYDGSATATVSSIGVLNNLAFGQTLNIAGTVTATFLDPTSLTANAHQGSKVVAFGGYTLADGSGLASNYVLSPAAVTSTGTITPKTVTVGGFTAGNKTYDGNASVSSVIAYGSLGSQVVGTDTVGLGTGGVVAVYDSVHTGGRTATASGYSLTGNTFNDYVLSTAAVTSTATITPKTVTVGGFTAGNKTYDGNATVSSVIAYGSLGSQVVGTDTVGLGTGGVVAVYDGVHTGGHTATASGYSLTGNAFNDYVLSTAAVTSTATITPKTVTVGGFTAGNKAYDGNTTVSSVIAYGSLGSQVVGTDTVGLGTSGVTAVYDSQHAATTRTATASGYSLTGNAFNDYVLSTVAVTSTATITPLTLSVAGFVAGNKVYDGNTTVSSVLAYGAVGGSVVLGDTIGLNTSGVTAVYDTQHVATTRTATASGYSLTGNTFNDYVLSTAAVTSTATITPKTVSVVGFTAGNKAYDGNTTVSSVLTYGSLGTQVVAGDTVGLGTGGVTAVYDSQHAATTRTATASNYSLTGNTFNDYVLSSAAVTSTATITPKTVSVVGFTAGNKSYDGNTTVSSVIAYGSLGTQVVAGDTVGLGTGGVTAVYDSQHAATTRTATASSYSLTGNTFNDYVLSSAAVTSTATITPLTLSVAGFVAGNKVYDGNTVVSSVLAYGAVGGSIVSGDTIGLNTSGVTAVYDSQHVATTRVATAGGYGLTGNTFNDYVLSTAAVTSTATITPKAVTVGGFTAGNKTYDGNTTVSSVVAYGSLGSQVVSGDTVGLGTAGVTAVYDSQHAATTRTATASNYSLTGNTFNDYVLSTAAVTSTATITPKTVTVGGFTAGNKAYDGNTTVSSVLTYGSLGTQVVAGDTVGLGTGGVTAVYDSQHAATTRTATASGYSLTGNTFNDYVLSSAAVTSTATITPLTLSVSGFVAGNKVYDGNTTVSSVLAYGAVGGSIVLGDTIGMNTSGVTAVYDSQHAATTRTATASGYSLTGNTFNDYVLSSAAVTSTATITPKTVSVIGFTAGDKAYDGNATASSVISYGSLGAQVVAGDAVSLNASGVLAVYDGTHAGAHTATASNYSLAGNTFNDYLLSSAAVTSTATITPRALSVSGVLVDDKPYDGTTAAHLRSPGALSDLVGTETLNFNTSSATAVFADPSIGLQPVQVSGYGISDGSGRASDYYLPPIVNTSASILGAAPPSPPPPPPPPPPAPIPAPSAGPAPAPLDRNQLVTSEAETGLAYKTPDLQCQGNSESTPSGLQATDRSACFPIAVRKARLFRIEDASTDLAQRQP